MWLKGEAVCWLCVCSNGFLCSRQPGNPACLLDGRVDVLQHVLVKVLVAVDSLQIFLELLSTRAEVSESVNYQTSEPALRTLERNNRGSGPTGWLLNMSQLQQ